MKVKELIKHLKKMPQDAEVVIQAHDNSEDEMQGPVDWVKESDSEVLMERFDGPVVVIQS